MLPLSWGGTSCPLCAEVEASGHILSGHKVPWFLKMATLPSVESLTAGKADER